jgi:hypothetical protein
MVTAPLNPEPSQDFQERLSPITRTYLARALIDTALGEPTRGSTTAHYATLPEHTLVFIEDAPSPIQEASREAMHRWNSALGTDVFEETPLRGEAHLIIKFLPKIPSNRSLAGRVTWNRTLPAHSQGAYLTGTIEVALQKPNGGKLTPADVTRVLLHELGHVLGLKDQKNPDEVMGPVRADGKCPPITERELRALRELQARSQRLFVTQVPSSPPLRVFRF